jgi:thiol-disulfide isomerase/thioredoxin
MRALAPVLGLAVLSLACGSSEKNPNDATVASNNAPVVADPPAVVEVPKVDEKPITPETPASAAPVASAEPGPAVEEAPAIAAGNDRPAPSFALDSITTRGKVGIVPGKVMIVDFWATWCAPCTKSFPLLQALYVKYKSKGLEIASVNVDEEKDEIAAFAKNHGATFPIAWDQSRKIAGLYKPPMMPSTYVVDKNGVIRHVHAGYQDGNMAVIEAEIKALF